MPLISHQSDPSGIAKPTFYEIENNTNLLDWMFDTFKNNDELCGELSCSFFLNGKEIFRNDHENADESILNINLNNNDHVVIVNRPAGLGVGAIIAIVSVVISVAVAVYTYMNMPDTGTSSLSSATTSPNNQLSAGQNSFRPYEAIPEIFGEGVAYPDFIQNSYYYYESNLKRQVGLFCLTVGEADSNGVNVGTTDIDAISNSSATFYGPGEDVPESYLTIHTQSTAIDGQTLVAPNDDSVIKTGQTVDTQSVLGSDTGAVIIYDGDYDDTTFLNDTGLTVGDYIYYNLSNDNPLNDSVIGSVEITGVYQESDPCILYVDNSAGAMDNSESTDATVGVGGEGMDEINSYIGWYELGGDEVEEVWANWTMPNGLRTAEGKAASMKVLFQIQTIVDDEYTGDIWEQEVKITKNTPDGQYNTVYFNSDTTPSMPVGKFAFRCKRVTNVLETDGSALEQVVIESVSSVTPYTDYDFGDTTKMLVLRKATLYSADQSGKKINVEYIRKLPTYDRDTGEYDEDTLTATDSFADAVAYTLIAQGNETVDTVDLSELYAIYDGLTDSELGEFSYTFDDADLSKGERVSTICAAARVISYHDGIKWRFKRDEAKTVRSALFNRRSTIGNQAQQSWQPQRSDDSDSVRIIYVDEDTNTETYVDRAFDTDTGEIVEDEIGFNLKEIELIGCRNVTQATNRADLEIRRLAYQRRSVTETTYRDAQNIDLLDLVGWCDPNDVDTFDGEILGIDGDIYDTTERFEPEDGETYVVFITDAEGYPSNTVQCYARDDTEFGFEASGISDAYVASGDQQVGSRYFIANATDLTSSNFTMTSRTPNNDGTVTVELAEYRAEMYEKDDITASSASPLIPTGLTALTVEQVGSTATATVTFDNDGLIQVNESETLWYSLGSTAGIGDLFEIKATLSSGTATGTFDEWVTLDSDQSWTTTDATEDSSPVEAVISFQVREINYTTNSSTSTINLIAVIAEEVTLPTTLEISDTELTQSTAGVNVYSNGSYVGTDDSEGTYTTETSNIGQYYEAQVSNLVGDDITGDVYDGVDEDTDTWATLSGGGVAWTLVNTSGAASKTATFDLTIREIADTANTSTVSVTLNSTVV